MGTRFCSENITVANMGTTFCGGDHESETVKAQQAKNRTYKKPIKKTTVLPGECSIKQTFNLEKDLSTLKQKYANKYKPLLSRNMISIKSENNIKENCINIMQFNMLADGLSTAYRWIETEKTFLNVDPLCLQWTYRGIRLIEEITRFKPDVIALEECDQLDFIMKYLQPIGYKSYFQQKTSSPIRHVVKEIIEERKYNDDFKMNYDGVAFIYNTNKFKCINENNIQYINMKKNKEKITALAVPLVFTLKNNIQKEILFIVTHLKSTKTQQGEELRERQINLLLKELIKNENGLPMILCCDLNANPIKNKKGYEPLCYNSITNKNNLGFESVYKLANGNEPEYTTFKLRPHGEDKHVLDYIFIKPKTCWNINKVLDIPNKNSEELIPNWWYPSDHFSIVAQLQWNQDDEKSDDV
eukprot:390738_1